MLQHMTLEEAGYVLLRAITEDYSDRRCVKEKAVKTIISALSCLCWISVDDNLPTPGERVIVTNGTFSGEAYYDEDGCWHRHYGLKWNTAFNGANITHWMPMPKLRGDEV